VALLAGEVFDVGRLTEAAGIVKEGRFLRLVGFNPPGVGGLLCLQKVGGCMRCSPLGKMEVASVPSCRKGFSSYYRRTYAVGATSRALVKELYRSDPTAGIRITSIVHNARSGPLIFFTEMSTSAHQIVMKRKMVIKGIIVSIRPNFIVSMKDSLWCLWL